LLERVAGRSGCRFFGRSRIGRSRVIFGAVEFRLIVIGAHIVAHW
jgi:hypothetical protein